MKEKRSHNVAFRYLSTLFIVWACFSGAHSLQAATLSISPPSGTYSIGQTIAISIIASSADNPMNAASGIVSFPTALLQATSISKAGSILSLWAEEPSFSNANGTVNFEGVALNPGFNGSYGKLITIYFKVKAIGNAEVLLSSASVLANDGQGTNILTGVGKANYVLQTSIGPVIPVPKNPAITAPVISKQDITAPINLTVKEIPRIDPTDPVIRLTMTAEDKQSGIDHFEVQVDTSESMIVQKGKEYASSPLLPGKHTFLVKAYDKAGNQSATSVEVEVSPLTVPRITYYQPLLVDTNPLVIKGESDYPNAEVKLVMNWTNELPVIYSVQTDASGNFVFVYSDKVKDGVYTVRSTITDKRGARSLEAAPISIAVEPSAVHLAAAKATNILAVAIPLIALIVLLLLLLYYAWHSFKSLRGKVFKESKEAETTATTAFGHLEKKVTDEITFLEGIEKDASLTEGERHFLGKIKNDLEDAKKSVNKEIQDIEAL